MSKINKYLPQTNNAEVAAWINSVVKNYLEKNEENVGEIEHCIDYLNARAKKFEKRGKPLRLKKMSYQEAKEKSEDWVKTMNKKGRNIVETEQDIEEVMVLDNGLRLVKLIGKNAYKREGKLMSHCVASYADKNTNVYSIRDSSNNPHCTLEVPEDYSSIHQIKGKGNGAIHPKYTGSVLKALKYFKKAKIKKNELAYLGYREISPEVFEIYNSNFKDFKYMNYDGSIFMYVHQKFNKKAVR